MMREVAASDNRGWIQSPRYDLALLALSPLLGIAISGVAWAIPGEVLGGTSLFLLGMPHYLSTYTFYMDDTNLRYYRTRKLAFFLGPVLVVGFLTLALVLHYYFLVAVVVDTWNVFHVSRQSNGILSVYRHLGAGNNLLERLPANVALLSISGGLYAVHIAKQPSFVYYFRYLPFDIAPFIGPLLLGVGAVALAILVVRMLRRPAGVGPAEWIFLGTSAALFLPYVLLDTRSSASSAMLSGHYVQYMGLLWLLHHRRYRTVEGSAVQRALAGIATRPDRIVIFLLGLVAATALVDRTVHHFNAMAFHTWILNVVVLLHFYLDGVFWAFRRPFVRESLGPYLVLPDRRLAAA
jgi:hypothetical protein